VGTAGPAAPDRNRVVTRELTILVADDDLERLRAICADTDGYFEDPADLIEHLARSAADGHRRPGSWERGWLTQATGWYG
jgi:hypothetical protein